MADAQKGRKNLAMEKKALAYSAKKHHQIYLIH
jgi:hypothetical protein